MKYEYRWCSPLGEVRVLTETDALCGVWFSGQAYEYTGASALQTELDQAPPVLQQTVAALRAACGSGPADIAMPPLRLDGTTLQQAVWAELGKLPRGTHLSYGRLAAQLGRPSAVRAVAAAVGRNPVSLLVPCHRVLGRDGALTGYAGGLGRKQALLALERGQSLPWRRVQQPHAVQYTQPLSVRPGDAVRWQARPDDGEFPGWAFAVDAHGIGGWAPQAWFRSTPEGARALRSYTATELAVAVDEAVLPLQHVGGWDWVRNASGGFGWIPSTCLGAPVAGITVL